MARTNFVPDARSMHRNTPVNMPLFTKNPLAQWVKNGVKFAL
jgi:hypothetical protein